MWPVVPADGTQPPVRLNPPMVVNGGVFPLIDDPYEPFALTLDGQQLVYIADQVVDETYELFSVPLDGSQFATRVNRSLVAGGDVTSFLLGPSGDVLYLADQQHDDVKELYRASTVRAHGVPRQPGTPLGSH